MHITVCCVASRPDLLNYVIYCFENQTYQDKSMLILDDMNLLHPTSGPNWIIEKVPERSSTLGAKRNLCARKAMERFNPDALVVWDDDDLYCVWSLEVMVKALEKADWCRPSQFCLWDRRQNKLQIAKTYGRPDRRDKAIQTTWGIRSSSFFAVDGYPVNLSVGEDMKLALRLEAIHTTECDPIEMGFKPWFICSPWRNQDHISSPTTSYRTLKRYNFDPKKIKTAIAKKPSIDIVNPQYLPGIVDRGFRKPDWYTDVTR